MSQTEAAIEDAIRNHITNDAPDNLVTGWFVIATCVVPDADESNTYWYIQSSQPIHVSLGLLDMARENLHRSLGEDE